MNALPRPTAVLLLAGRSLRTWPLTADFPKPLLPLWGRPLTERVLDQLEGVVDTAVLVVGHGRERILAHFGDRYGSIRLVPVVQREARGTADALRVAAPLAGDRALVMNGDDYYHGEDLARVSRFPTAILCQEATDPWNRATVEVTADDWLVDLEEKPPAARSGELSSIGAYSLLREDLAHLGEVGESIRGELELPDLIRILIRLRGVRAVRARRPWIPLTYAWDVVGRMAPLFAGEPPWPGTELGFATTPGGRGSGARHVAPRGRVAADAWLSGPVEVADDARIEAGARVERAVLLRGARIGPGAVVEDSVLGPGAVVGAGAQVRSARVERIRVLDQEARVGVERVGACLGEGASIPEGAVTPPGLLLGPGERFGASAARPPDPCATGSGTAGTPRPG